jgi:hypothetical protein
MNDSIYKNVVSGTESLYQKYFEEILGQIDVQNFTNQTLGKLFDRVKGESDHKVVEKIVTKAQEEYKLYPGILQIMLEQYIWADELMREIDKSRWIYRVMNRKDEDFFPDSMVVYTRNFKSE